MRLKKLTFLIDLKKSPQRQLMPHQQNNDCQRKPPERYFLGVLLVVDEYLGGGYEKRESGCSPSFYIQLTLMIFGFCPSKLTGLNVVC